MWNDQPIAAIVTQTKKLTRLESYYHCRKPKDRHSYMAKSSQEDTAFNHMEKEHKSKEVY